MQFSWSHHVNRENLNRNFDKGQHNERDTLLTTYYTPSHCVIGSIYDYCEHSPLKYRVRASRLTSLCCVPVDSMRHSQPWEIVVIMTYLSTYIWKCRMENKSQKWIKNHRLVGSIRTKLKIKNLTNNPVNIFYVYISHSNRKNYW